MLSPQPFQGVFRVCITDPWCVVCIFVFKLTYFTYTKLVCILCNIYTTSQNWLSNAQVDGYSLTGVYFRKYAYFLQFLIRGDVGIQLYPSAWHTHSTHISRIVQLETDGVDPLFCSESWKSKLERVTPNKSTGTLVAGRRIKNWPNTIRGQNSFGLFCHFN